MSSLNANLRTVIAVLMTAVVSYLALRGDTNAITALVTAFTSLMGFIWGERAALKVPGKDA